MFDLCKTSIVELARYIYRKDFLRSVNQPFYFMILPRIPEFGRCVLNSESQNQAIDIPVVLPSFPINILGKLVKGFMSYDRTYKQETNKQSEITSLYI